MSPDNVGRTGYRGALLVQVYPVVRGLIRYSVPLLRPGSRPLPFPDTPCCHAESELMAEWMQQYLCQKQQEMKYGNQGYAKIGIAICKGDD